MKTILWVTCTVFALSTALALRTDAPGKVYREHNQSVAQQPVQESWDEKTPFVTANNQLVNPIRGSHLLKPIIMDK